MSSIPKSTKILVIGGGPGGSTAATLLAREGFEVTLLEQAHFPRYHIGESLLPSMLEILDLLGVREKLEAHGFVRKEGAYLEWGPERWALNFGEMSGNLTYSFQVVRSEFDQLLLEHARSQGALAFEGVEVRSLSFDGPRPVSAHWVRKVDNGDPAGEGDIAFDYLIDASGRWSLMSTRYLRNRHYHKIFQNVGIWGYWKGADRMATGRDGDIAVSSIPNGWLWGIPLHDGTMSVGVVMHKETVTAKKPVDVEAIYAQAIQDSPLITDILRDAELVSPVQSEMDYSYASENFCGPGYFMVGDAAAFLDPLLSSGVHLATFSAMLAAASLTSFYHGEVSEAEMQSFFEKSYRQAYLRFLVFLSAFYDVGRTKETYFWEAQRVTQEEVSTSELKRAFLKLVTGLKDLSDASNEDTRHYVLEEMTRRVDENLKFRRDKMKLASLQGEEQQARQANARFFSSVEGMFSLNQEDAVEGLYVQTRPNLKLARVKTVA
jgi:flavin-dependent dehydrogenase